MLKTSFKGLMGTFDRDRTQHRPMLNQEDSSIKKAMKGVMKLGRKNRPKIPTPIRKE
jgi:hypothetical protein